MLKEINVGALGVENRLEIGRCQQLHGGKFFFRIGFATRGYLNSFIKATSIFLGIEHILTHY
jgi:hypothetical protein